VCWGSRGTRTRAWQQVRSQCCERGNLVSNQQFPYAQRS
jgi:hypothetical protein